jgi:hypothetical protein
MATPSKRRHSGDERSGPFRCDGFDAGASQCCGVNLVRFAEIVSLREQVRYTHVASLFKGGPQKHARASS